MRQADKVNVGPFTLRKGDLGEYVIGPYGNAIAILPASRDPRPVLDAINCCLATGTCAQAKEWLDLFPNEQERIQQLRRIRKIRGAGPETWAAYSNLVSAFLQGIYSTFNHHAENYEDSKREDPEPQYEGLRVLEAIDGGHDLFGEEEEFGEEDS